MDGTMHARPGAARVGPGLNRDIQTKIGQQLRAIYDDVVDQGVPDRFVELLRSLDKETGKGERGDKDSTE
ncbi:MAG: NepR family anti-sigma factor [Xanthobacteraceae bacterium]